MCDVVRMKRLGTPELRGKYMTIERTRTILEDLERTLLWFMRKLKPPMTNIAARPTSS
jgi:hypothetical protein